MESLELTMIDTRLEHTRCRNAAVEKRLLASIMERDILEPVEVAGTGNESSYVLVDGFKRYRCAKKLSKHIIPAYCIATDIAGGVVSFLRRSSRGGVSALEEAALIEELYKRYGMTIYDIAHHTGRSPAWVSMRLNMLEGLSDLVRRKILTGAFPARAYMYGVKGFTRVNTIPQQRVDDFVRATSSKGFSTRELFVLCRAFFTGGPGIERLVLEGDVHKALRIIKEGIDAHAIPGIQTEQQVVLQDLESVFTAMKRTIAHRESLSINPEVNLHCNYITRMILNCLDTFSQVIRDLHDRSKPAACRTDPV